MSLAQHPAVVAALRGSTALHGVEHHERVGSTNDLARQRLVDGEAPGLVVVADRQTAGRGRAGRAWTDDVDGPDGPANLAVTATTVVPAGGGALLPLVAGLAVADAFAALGGRPALKWPNDVLLDARKACGILVERHRIGAADVALLGCGLDVDWRGTVRAGDAAGWTSLGEHLGRAPDRGTLLGELLRALTFHLGVSVDEPAATAATYRERCTTLGRAVTATLPNGDVLRGDAVDLDVDGALLLDTGEGRVAVRAGDVRHVRPVDGSR